MFAPVPTDTSGPRAVSPDTSVSIAADTPEPVDVEARRVSSMMCDVTPKVDGTGYHVWISPYLFVCLFFVFCFLFFCFVLFYFGNSNQYVDVLALNLYVI